MTIFFGWLLFLWLLILVYSDLFRRDDISGWIKFVWIIFTIFLPFIGTFAYLLTNMGAMQDRRWARANQAGRGYAPVNLGSSADQIARAKQLLDTGAISAEEYATLKQKALA